MVIYCSFDCPDFEKYDNNTCFWEGKSYKIGEEVLEGLNNCAGEGCVCTKFGDGLPGFRCSSDLDYDDCIIYEDDKDDDATCIRQYEELKQCRASNVICGSLNYIYLLLRNSHLT